MGDGGTGLGLEFGALQRISRPRTMNAIWVVIYIFI